MRPRASDLNDQRPQSDEWRPPSDWDKAWKAHKKVPSPSSLGISKANSGRGSPASGGGASSNLGSRSKSRGGSGGGSTFSPFAHMEQYVSRSPSRSDYPLAEEVDSVKRTERQALAAWTDTRFTYAGFGMVALLFVYMAVIVGPPPS